MDIACHVHCNKSRCIGKEVNRLRAACVSGNPLNSPQLRPFRPERRESLVAPDEPSQQCGLGAAVPVVPLEAYTLRLRYSANHVAMIRNKA